MRARHDVRFILLPAEAPPSFTHHSSQIIRSTTTDVTPDELFSARTHAHHEPRRLLSPMRRDDGGGQRAARPATAQRYEVRDAKIRCRHAQR